MLFLVSYGELARVGGSEGILVENTPNDGTEVIGHMCVPGGLRLHMTSGLPPTKSPKWHEKGIIV